MSLEKLRAVGSKLVAKIRSKGEDFEISKCWLFTISNSCIKAWFRKIILDVERSNLMNNGAIGALRSKGQEFKISKCWLFTKSNSCVKTWFRKIISDVERSNLINNGFSGLYFLDKNLMPKSITKIRISKLVYVATIDIFKTILMLASYVYLMKKPLGKKLMSWSRNKNQKAKFFLYFGTRDALRKKNSSFWINKLMSYKRRGL